MNAWRGTSLIMEKSTSSVSGRRLRHPLTRDILNSHKTEADAIRYCRQNGYSWMRPPQNVDFAKLEQRI